MLLLDPKSAATAIGQSCKKQDGSDNPNLLELLRLITPRVEGMLEVKSLARGTYRDTFEAPVPWRFPFRHRVLLSNGFIVPGSLDHSGLNYTDGYEFDSLKFNLILGYGSVGPRYFDATTYSLEYQSGFEIPGDPADPNSPNNEVHANPDYRVAIGVPEFIRAVVATILIHHYRVKLSSPVGIPKDVPLSLLNEETKREVRSLLQGKFVRPRSGLAIPYAYEQIA